MRYSILFAGLAALSVVAQAQTPAWQFYEGDDGSKQVFVQAGDGSQLLLKCDKTGKGSVSGMVYTPEKLLVTGKDAFEKRPVQLTFDGGNPADESWRFYENVAMAVNQPGERTLPRFVEMLADSSTLKVRMITGPRNPTIEKDFDVAGAREAINQVYEACEDTNPLD